MAWVIAGMYEILEQIGAGGGGIVYLGRHLRLNKQIVLKADKRTLNRDPQVLRREVDVLKGVHHAYIPQVYDFVQENGVVYTVMDFIEGESLDMLLKKGQIPTQPQIVRWSYELLEALECLHSHPPHGILHGDIKPANIMLRPNGDICLIDYNIALALGENGAVRVGFSWGYASPEHYGIDYRKRNKHEVLRIKSSRSVNRTKETRKNEKNNFQGSLKTVDMENNRAQTPLASDKGGGSSSKVIMLDTRSDIYSLGATLYHLLSGQRPPRDALEVRPLGESVCSLQVSKIIEKAMAADPDKRYQSASEMLNAFRQLHRRDSRVIRRKKRIAVWTVALSVLFLSGVASAFTGINQLKQTQTALTLAEYSADRLKEGDVSDAIALALEAMPDKKSILDAPVTAQAQKALTDALGVYNLSDGFEALDTIKLPSAPFAIAVSPNGSSFAAVCEHQAIIFDMESLKETAVLPIQNSALSDVIFVDESTIVYAGEQGVTAYDLEKGQILWTGQEATTLALSGDKTVVAVVNRDESYASVYRMEDGTKIADCSFEGRHMKAAANDIFANPGNRIFELNRTGDLLAVSFSDGGLQIFDLYHQDEDLIIYEHTAYGYFEGGFSGDYFAFGADKDDESIFGLVDTKDGVYVGEYESRDQFFVKANEGGIYFANGNLLVNFEPDSLNQTELAYTEERNIVGFAVGDNGDVLTATDDRGFSFYDKGANPVLSEICDDICDFTAIAGDYALIANRSSPSVRVLKKESHDEAQLMSYDARYLHDEARISQDGRTAVLFDYKEFCICDMEGRVICHEEFPDSETIYDQQFRKKEGDSWLEVIWYDGTVRCYSGDDGSVISEEKRKPPEKDLYEEFYTDKYRVESSLHKAPEVYDLESNQKVAVLQEEDYLTYVTQLNEYIVTEYISAEGERYGLLLNDQFQTLAYLPRLCDIAGDMLVFDYGSGNLRQCRLYSLQELRALGEKYLQNE